MTLGGIWTVHQLVFWKLFMKVLYGNRQPPYFHYCKIVHETSCVSKHWSQFNCFVHQCSQDSVCGYHNKARLSVSTARGVREGVLTARGVQGGVSTTKGVQGGVSTANGVQGGVSTARGMWGGDQWVQTLR